MNRTACREESSALPSSYIPRMQLFEFHESEWVPETFRNAITELLHVLGTRLRIHETVLPVLERLLDETGANRIVDLCSGAGGPILPIQRDLAIKGRYVTVVLTDKFPNLAAFSLAKQESGGFVCGFPGLVD